MSDARQLEVRHFPFPSLDASTFLIAKYFYSYQDDFLRQNQCLYKNAKSVLLVDMLRRLKNDMITPFGCGSRKLKKRGPRRTFQVDRCYFHLLAYSVRKTNTL